MYLKDSFQQEKKYFGVRGNLNPEISLVNSAANWQDLGFITNHIISFRFKIKLWLWCKFKKKNYLWCKSKLKLFIEILHKTLKRQNPQTFLQGQTIWHFSFRPKTV